MTTRVYEMGRGQEFDLYPDGRTERRRRSGRQEEQRATAATPAPAAPHGGSPAELREARNRSVAEARRILDGGEVSTADQMRADALLTEAGQLDGEMAGYKRGRREGLALASTPRGAALTFRGQRLHLRQDTREYRRAQGNYEDQFSRFLAGEGQGEQLGLMVGKDDKGGYLAPIVFALQMLQRLDNLVFIRELATVVPVYEGASLKVGAWETDFADADWSAEVPTSDISEDDAETTGGVELIPHLMTKLVKASTRFLRSTPLDAEGVIADRMAYKFAVPEEKAFLTGTGVNQPLGIFMASPAGIDTDRDVTCVGTTAFTADDLIGLVESLNSKYLENATFLLSREAVKRARKLKDGNGQYIWRSGLSDDDDTLLDIPVAVSEYVPSTFTAGQYVAAVGDIRAGYWIADGLDFEVQRLDELFALKQQVGFVGRKSTDGSPVVAEAFSRLKLAAS